MLQEVTQPVKNAKFRRPKNKDVRSREYLMPHEVESLRKAAKSIGRHKHRDDTIILLGFRHGLRVGEIIGLRWCQIDLTLNMFHMNRLKSGINTPHHLEGDEVRALRRLQREYPSKSFVFTGERGAAPLAPRTVQGIIARAGVIANFDFPIHPHMLRHSTGYYLANKGKPTLEIQYYLGHACISNTAIYTVLAPDRFKNFW